MPKNATQYIQIIYNHWIIIENGGWIRKIIDKEFEKGRGFDLGLGF